jgi:excisionase family DNA binding protein
MPKLTDLICLADAAKMLGIHRQTAFLLVKARKLPAVQVGKAWVTTRRAVSKLLGKRSSTASLGSPLSGSGKRISAVGDSAGIRGL